ncbi:MAG: response regulator transcription factor [Pontibacterium sp.]
MLNLLLIEDDIDLASTVVEYFELENIQCDHASNGVAGLDLVSKQRYDAILLDLNLPRLDGLTVCQQLRQRGDDTPILMLTARGQLDDKVEGFKAGTDDYLVKPFELQELVLRVQALSRRRSGQARKLTFGPLALNLDTQTATREGVEIKLSPTGWKLLETLVRSAPKIVPRQQLEEAVWGDSPPTSNGLKVHLFNLRKQLDDPFDQPLVVTFAGKGVGLNEALK